MIFAYLIMAHDNEEKLRILIDALDYRENDIYLHIDKKSDINLSMFSTKNAKLHKYMFFRFIGGYITNKVPVFSA